MTMQMKILIMLMSFFALGLAAYGDLRVKARNSAPRTRGNADNNAGDAEAVYLLKESVSVRSRPASAEISMSPDAPIEHSRYRIFIRPLLSFVDHAGKVSGAEAVVDVNYGDSAGTGIEHGEQSGKPAKEAPYPTWSGLRSPAIRQTSEHAG
jgi:hypothetical protein